MNEQEILEAYRMLKAEGFSGCNETEAWFNFDRRKHFSRRSIRDATSLEQFRSLPHEPVLDDEFWFYSHYLMNPDDFQRIVSKYELSDCKPINKAAVARPHPQ